MKNMITNQLVIDLCNKAALVCRRISIRVSGVGQRSSRPGTAAIPADNGSECQNNLAGPNS